MKKYIVRDGDTLESISEETGIRMSLLRHANPHITSPFWLQPGEVLSLPELNKPALGPKPQQSGAQGHSDTTSTQGLQSPAEARTPGYFGLVWPHVVQSDETWSSVSDYYQVPIQALQRLNQGKSQDGLRQGDILYVPNVVQPGANPQPFAAWRSTPPATAQDGPHAWFSEGAPHTQYRAVDAAWRKAYQGMNAWNDPDESSSYESSWSEGLDVGDDQ